MALFSHLDFEKSIQVNDKTRFDGSKSFVSKGSTAISTMTVKPGADGSAISVYDASPSERFLDWEFSAFNIDVDATNNKLDFKEASGSQLTATLDTATYTLATLATEIKTQMDSAGALTYTVAFDLDDKLTISAASEFSLLPTEGTNKLVSILPIVGYSPKAGFGDSVYDNETELTGKRVRKLPRAVTIEIGDGSSTQDETIYVDVFSEAGDALLSADFDLIKHKSDIFRWVRDGRNSFKDQHRRSQELILAFLDDNGYIDINGDKFNINAFVDLEEFRQWSTFLTLRIIHEDLSNASDDIFERIASQYAEKEKIHRRKSLFRIDVDGDGKADIGEGVMVGTGKVIRS